MAEALGKQPRPTPTTGKKPLSVAEKTYIVPLAVHNATETLNMSYCEYEATLRNCFSLLLKSLSLMPSLPTPLN